MNHTGLLGLKFSNLGLGPFWSHYSTHHFSDFLQKDIGMEKPPNGLFVFICNISISTSPLSGSIERLKFWRWEADVHQNDLKWLKGESFQQGGISEKQMQLGEMLQSIN